jgi:hypothetical protein
VIKYILKTLQKEDYVFIERLGSFRMNLCHAKIDGDTIQPPHYEVVFSQNDNEENNFALANLISCEKQCLFTFANEEITAWVSELLTALQNNKSVTYEDFGTFMLDKKGNITFESAVIPQLNSQFEGLEPIDVKHVISIPVVEPEPEEVKEDDDKMKVVEPEPVAEPEPVVENEPEEAKEDDDKMKVVEPEQVAQPEPVVENEPEEVKEDDDKMKVVDPEPVAEPEPVVENEPEEAKEDDDKMKVVETEPVTEPEPVVEPEPDDDEKGDEEEEEDEEDEEEEDEVDRKKRHGLAWLWVILLLLIVLGVLGYIFKDKLMGYYQQWKDRKQPVEQVVATDDNADATATVDEVTEPEPVGANNDSPEETVSEPEPEPVTYTPAVVKQSADGRYDYIRFEKGHYYVIAGSFPSEQDVIRHIRQKKLDQYSPKILKQDGVSNLRVCIGVFDTEDEAERFAKGVNSSYWVLK